MSKSKDKKFDREFFVKAGRRGAYIRMAKPGELEAIRDHMRSIQHKGAAARWKKPLTPIPPVDTLEEVTDQLNDSVCPEPLRQE